MGRVVIIKTLFGKINPVGLGIMLCLFAQEPQPEAAFISVFYLF